MVRAFLGRHFLLASIKRSWRARLLVLSLQVSLTCPLCEGAQPGLSGLPASSSPSTGVELVCQQIEAGPSTIYIVRIDRARSDLAWATTLSNGTVAGLSTVSEQVREFGKKRGTPLVAINGDLFTTRPGAYKGDPSGLQIVDGELVSAPKGESFWIDPTGQPHIGRVTAKFSVVAPQGEHVRFGLNEARPDDGAVLFTPRFGTSTPAAGGRELVLESGGRGSWLPLQAGQAYTARVRQVRDSGDTPISPQSMVLSIGPQVVPKVPPLEKGTTVCLSLATEPNLEGVNVAIGGGPALILKGEARVQPYANEPRNPRTAIGWNDKCYILIVADGRQPGYSMGMTLAELCAVFQRLGCTDAINLDGGGSSTLWVGGKVINRPSDGRERRIANALIVYRIQSQSTPPR